MTQPHLGQKREWWDILKGVHNKGATQTTHISLDNIYCLFIELNGFPASHVRHNVSNFPEFHKLFFGSLYPCPYPGKGAGEVLNRGPLRG